VLWLGRPTTESNCEQASSLPQKMVEEYESGVKHDLQKDFSTSGGLTVYTLLSAVHCNSDDMEPNVKKTKFIIMDQELAGKFKYRCIYSNFAYPMQNYSCIYRQEYSKIAYPYAHWPSCIYRSNFAYPM